MAEAVATAAAVVGLVVPTLHGIRILADDLRGIVNAPKVVQRLTDELELVSLSLECLKTVEDAQWEALGAEVVKQSETSLATCTRVCDEVRSDMNRWTRRTREHKWSWRERANIGFFKEKRIIAILEQLQSCKISLNTVASTAGL